MLTGMTNEEFRSALAARIKRERKLKYRTQEALAAQIGKRQCVISRWESGEQSPTYENLVLLAGAFRLTVADLAAMPYVTPEMPDERIAAS